MGQKVFRLTAQWTLPDRESKQNKFRIRRRAAETLIKNQELLSNNKYRRRISSRPRLQFSHAVARQSSSVKRLEELQHEKLFLEICIKLSARPRWKKVYRKKKKKTTKQWTQLIDALFCFRLHKPFSVRLSLHSPDSGVWKVSPQTRPTKTRKTFEINQTKQESEAHRNKKKLVIA